MSSRRIINVFVSLVMLASLVMGSTYSAIAAPASPIDESKVPHYFGPYPNWANSPFTLPDAQVVITGDGVGAEAVATVGAGGAVLSITVTSAGSGYTSVKVDITGSGTGAAAKANIVKKGAVSGVTIDVPGSGYTAPVLAITGNGSGAAGTVYGSVDQVTLDLNGGGGSGYTFPTVDFDLPDAPDGVQARGHAVDIEPDGIIDAVVVDYPGSGYLTAPGVTIRDGTIFDPIPNGGSGAKATSTLSVSSVVMDTFGLGYSWATATISDAVGAGTGALATAVLQDGIISSIEVTKGGSGYLTPGGIQKFLDTLPGLTPAGVNNLGQYIPVAVPDTTTFPGTDFYVIAVVQHREKMHSSLPPTLLREYVQLATDVVPGTALLSNDMLDGTSQAIMMPGTAAQAVGVDNPHYLGPVIVAAKDRAVRIVFYNLLPTGSDGDLFLPTDSSIMGSGMGPMPMMDPVDQGTVMDEVRNPVCTEYPKSMDCFKDNRATLHLHGGVTPWISDGTPHQWITPANETTPWPEGVSVENVPDMEPGAAPASVPDCSGPADGCQTFYYTNQQSARLMFYHDHSWGITRLNVYAGEAAGYIITDPAEQKLFGPSGTFASLGEGIPLIIQDRTFVPQPATLALQDPTWDSARWGGYGNLWYHHVYMPAQNPGDPGGMSAYGRWMYGPWFWPPSNAKYQPISNPYFDPACNLDDPATWQYDTDPFCEPPLIPGTPNISAGMEQFNDTPLVNGTVYPTTTLQPQSYRLRILNAANDRFWNLQWYVADSTGTEVALKAAEVAAAQTDPVVFPTPDTALSPVGPSWIQIGTEGGFLPAPVVVPNQPITWITDPTRFDVGNVDQHSLLLAPAERADVIVDFSKYAGKTLILYNDAPAAFPARVPSYDYYTGAPDLSPAGAPTTLPGYGPNTRTIMQVKIANTPAAPAFNLTALNAAFRHHADGSGIFESGQHPIIVGQAAYNSAYGTSFAASGWCNSPTNPSAKCDGFARISEQGHDLFKFDTLKGVKVSIPLEPKAIHDEMNSSNFDEFGRMTANLGLEAVPANPGAQNVVLYPYTASPTEVIDATNLPKGDVNVTPIATADGSQIWKITHNGVDTHPIHFHLYDVQVLNRVTWDNIIIPPDKTELGWKDTVRISPLEDTIVALRPIIPTLPFDIPNSVHEISPMMPTGVELSPGLLADPQGNPVRVFNNIINFGWEYVYHCHILSHEEMDMMRPVILAVPPVPPTVLDLVQGTLTWSDNSLSETSFIVEKSSDGGVTWTQVYQVDRLLTDPNTAVDTLSFTDGAWVDGDIYRVAALNAVGDFSVPGFPTKTVKSPYAFLGMGAPPAAPVNLSATLQAGPQVNLTWTDLATDETGFIIQRSDNNGPFAQLSIAPALTGTGGASYLDAAVTPGHQYVYRVAATNLSGPSAWSNMAIAGVPAIPAAVTLSGALQAGSQVSLSWTDTNETSFIVERSDNGGAFVALTTLAANTLGYIDTGVAAGNSYAYQVQAVNISGFAYSNQWSIAVPSVPAAPTNLIAPNITASQVDLAWTSNSANEDGFIIQRSIDAGATWSEAGKVAAGVTAFSDTTVLPITDYVYRVYAFNLGGSSLPSNDLPVTTPNATPAAPSNLTAALQNGPQVSLSWTDNSNNEAGFGVERSDDGGMTWNVPVTTAAGVTSLTDSTVLAGSTYVYQVFAFNASGNSAPSNTASISVPAVPASVTLTATLLAGPQIGLDWTDTNETSFTLERSDNGGAFASLATLAADTLTYTDTTVSVGNSYVYRVQAANESGTTPSTQASVNVPLPSNPPLAPTGLTATLQAGPQVSLSWTDNAVDETGLIIERSDNGGAFVQIGTLGPLAGTGSVASFLDTGVTAGDVYTYQVAAQNAAGSSYSNQATVDVLTPLAPTNLLPGKTTTSTVLLTWTDNAVNETGYTLEWSLDGVNWSSIDLPANTASFTVQSLTANTTYQFRVRAYNLVGPSAYSNIATAKTKRK